MPVPQPLSYVWLMQMTTEFKEPGTLAKPGVIGRLVRFLMGIIILYFFFTVLIGYESILRLQLSILGWIGVAYCFYALPAAVNIGFNLDWKWWPQVIYLFLVMVAGLVGYFIFGSFFSPHLGLAILVLLYFILGYMGISFFLAAVLAVPGCEVRAIPYLIGRIRGRPVQEHHCPGFLDPLDKWEARKKKS